MLLKKPDEEDEECGGDPGEAGKGYTTDTQEQKGNAAAAEARGGTADGAERHALGEEKEDMEENEGQENEKGNAAGAEASDCTADGAGGQAVVEKSDEKDEKEDQEKRDGNAARAEAPKDTADGAEGQVLEDKQEEEENEENKEEGAEEERLEKKEKEEEEGQKPGGTTVAEGTGGKTKRKGGRPRTRPVRERSGPKKPVGGGYQVFFRKFRSGESYKQVTHGMAAKEISQLVAKRYSSLRPDEREVYEQTFKDEMAKWWAEKAVAKTPEPSAKKRKRSLGSTDEKARRPSAKVHQRPAKGKRQRPAEDKQAPQPSASSLSSLYEQHVLHARKCGLSVFEPWISRFPVKSGDVRPVCCRKAAGTPVLLFECGSGWKVDGQAAWVARFSAVFAECIPFQLGEAHVHHPVHQLTNSELESIYGKDPLKKLFLWRFEQIVSVNPQLRVKGKSEQNWVYVEPGQLLDMSRGVHRSG